MSTTPTAVFPQKNSTGKATTTAACVIGTAEAPTNTELLFTAGPNGSLVTRITSIPRGTVTATAMYLFLSKNGETTKFLKDSELVPVHNLSATANIPETNFANYSEDTPLHLDAGDKLYIGMAVAQAAGITTNCEAMDL